MIPRLFLLPLTLFLAVTNSFSLVQGTNSVTYMGWQTVDYSNIPGSNWHRLPPNPLAIAASTDPIYCDFVAVANDPADVSNTFYFYLLDHNNLQVGWQKKAPFLNADVTNIQYGLGHFVAMGTDRTSGQPLVAISADNGRTWSQAQIWGEDLKLGKGHYDSAAFSPKIGLMTGKDGALAHTTDGAKWVEIVPPSNIPRKVVYTNVAPSGAPIDNEFQLCVTIQKEQKTLCGFLLFGDIGILGSMVSADGKNWSYPISYPIVRNQLLIYQNKVFLVNDTLAGISYAYHNQTNLDNPNFDSVQLGEGDNSPPIISIFQFASYQQNWVAVGYNALKGDSLSLFSDSRILNGNIVFSTDPFPQFVKLVVANQSGFLAIGDDGTTYYSTPAIRTAVTTSTK